MRLPNGKIHFPGFFLLLLILALPALVRGEGLKPFKASPDQVLVLYNADWPHKSEGSSAANDSKEVAEYYVRMHTDRKTGKKPSILGLSCRHFGKSHLNRWFIPEESNDNANGIVFRGKGKPPADLNWVRDSRKVEIHVDVPDADWDSLRPL